MNVLKAHFQVLRP